MKIILNGTIFYKQRYGGISRYFCNLSQKFIKKGINFKITAPFYKNKYLKEVSSKYKSGIYISRFPEFKFFDSFQSFYNNNQISKFKPDIVHETYYSTRLKKKNYLKIITVYDLIHEKLSDFYKLKIDKKKSFEDVDYFISISENTKSDLIEMYNIPEDKIKVIYLGGDHVINQNNPKRFKNDSKPFILFVGSREKYKDFNSLVYAYVNSNKISKDFNLYCFGGGNFSKEEKKLFANLNISEKIFNLQGDDTLLYDLYKTCRCFVSTSLYEGFGIPVVEAMQSNCPVFLSNCNTYLEIAKNNAIFFEKKNVEDLKNKLEQHIYNEADLKIISSKAKTYSSIFSWEKCTEETLNLYKKLRF